MTPEKDEDDRDSEYHIQLPKGLARQLSETAQHVTKLYASLYGNELQRLAQHATQVQQELIKAFSRIDTQQIVADIRKMAESVVSTAKDIDAHLPDNWPDELRDAAGLCIRGVPVVFVPRAAIVSKLLKSKDMASVKLIIAHNSNSPLIIEDCEKVLQECEWLPRDMCEHIQEAILCYKSGQYRAAQSTATIAFDCLLNDIVDVNQFRKQNGNKHALSHNVVGRYTNINPELDLMRIPLGRAPFYTLLMLPIIGRMLTKFDMYNKATYGNDANRHAATHMVSSRQYKKSNALLTIMTVVSICKVTQLCGKYWVQSATEQYGFRLLQKDRKKKFS